MATIRHIWPSDMGATNEAAAAAFATAPPVRSLQHRPSSTTTATRSVPADQEAPVALFQSDPRRAQGAVYNGTGETLYVAGEPDGPWFPVADATYYDHGATGPLYAYMEATDTTLVVIEERF